MDEATKTEVLFTTGEHDKEGYKHRAINYCGVFYRQRRHKSESLPMGPLNYILKNHLEKGIIFRQM